MPALASERARVGIAVDTLLEVVRASWPPWIEDRMFIAHVGGLLADSDISTASASTSARCSSAMTRCSRPSTTITATRRCAREVQYRAEFAAAFEEAISSLTDRQRGVLRYRFVDGAGVDTIAAVYKIHRATCHRWISDARAALARQTEKRLRMRLSANDDDLVVIRALIESQLELSLSRMFAR